MRLSRKKENQSLEIDIMYEIKWNKPQSFFSSTTNFAADCRKSEALMSLVTMTTRET